MAKTATFGVMHVATSFVVTYAITGSYTIAGVVTFVEPLVNTVMHYFFDAYWDHPKAVAARAQVARRMPAWASGAVDAAMPAMARAADHGHAHHFSTKARSIT
ncbi:MAG: hypothetical protein RI907_3659 [Pseudomonadota bacterium]|jgi:uncharacterized membrane protein